MRNLLTTSQIADQLGVPFWRVRYILKSNRGIEPTQVVGVMRLYDRASIRRISAELEAIDNKRRAAVPA